MHQHTKSSIKTIAIGIEIKSRTSTGMSDKDSLLELVELAKTAQLEVVETFLQSRQSPARGTYIGQGKIDSIKQYIKDNSICCVITDDELTPAQSKTLEKALNTKVIDRTGLILDIFSQRAKTFEAKLQVELAQLNYLLPRLTRLWTHLSRLGGGIGTRGPGETQLESDKRQISKRISHIKGKLKKIQSDRTLRRQQRKSTPLLSGAIVGYTNAGKSTLMNRLSNARVFAEDKLFATLDPTSRQYSLSNSDNIILTDTVGFIQKLPTMLIKAFYSTLEEVTEADFLLHVIDASHPNALEFIQTSQDIISSLNASEKPVLYIFNKWDQVTKPNQTKKAFSDFYPNIFISAKHDIDMTTFQDSLKDLLAPFEKTLTFFVPYNRMDIINLLHRFGRVENVIYEEKIEIKVTINEIIADKIVSQLYLNKS